MPEAKKPEEEDEGMKAIREAAEGVEVIEERALPQMRLKKLAPPAPPTPKAEDPKTIAAREALEAEKKAKEKAKKKDDE